MRPLFRWSRFYILELHWLLLDYLNFRFFVQILSFVSFNFIINYFQNGKLWIKSKTEKNHFIIFEFWFNWNLLQNCCAKNVEFQKEWLIILNYLWLYVADTLSMGDRGIEPERNSGQGRPRQQLLDPVTGLKIKPDPTFDYTQPTNVTALIGKTAYLTCRVRHLGDKTVRPHISWFVKTWNFHKLFSSKWNHYRKHF